MYEDLKKAGEIAKKVVEFSKSLLKSGTNLLEIAEKIEEKIIDLGGFPAFPVNLSINNIAAHYTPNINEKRELKDGDVIKVDFGVSVNGYIVDLAYTEEINDNKYKNLINASREALIEVRKIIRKDIEIREIGRKIEETIKKYRFNPIYNLYGHKIDRYILHSGLNIPNYDNGSSIKLDYGVYAVEPFATNGNGYVEEKGNSGIYSIINLKPVRDIKLREFLEKIYEKYRTLPFAYRWIYNEFKDKYNVKIYVEMLKRESIIYEYPVLVEKSNGIVTQFETTFYIYEVSQDLIGHI